jgi:hypothetical protein
LYAAGTRRRTGHRSPVSVSLRMLQPIRPHIATDYEALAGAVSGARRCRGDSPAKIRLSRFRKIKARMNRTFRRLYKAAGSVSPVLMRPESPRASKRESKWKQEPRQRSRSEVRGPLRSRAAPRAPTDLATAQ